MKYKILTIIIVATAVCQCTVAQQNGMYDTMPNYGEQKAKAILKKFGLNSNEDKYQFKTIEAKAFTNTNKKSNSVGNVINSFYNQTTSSLEYSLPPEASSFISTYRSHNQSGLRAMKNWGAYYLNTMQSILVQHGVPKELVYLAVIETDLDIRSVSWTGAVGMWQFMPETGRQYGLSVGYGNDERYDWVKSTHAAANYCNDLYRTFNDWLLVVAAYNGGPGRVRSAIARSGSRNFWQLQYYLPLESSNHVKKFIATHLIMGDGTTSFNTPIMATNVRVNNSNNAYFNPLLRNKIAVDTTLNKVLMQQLTGRYNSLIIAKYTQLDILTFNTLNPNFDTEINKKESTYNLRLPASNMGLFAANKMAVMNESLQLYLTINEIPVGYTIPQPNKKIKYKKN